MLIISHVLYLDSTALTLDLLMTMTFLRFPIKKIMIQLMVLYYYNYILLTILIIS